MPCPLLSVPARQERAGTDCHGVDVRETVKTMQQPFGLASADSVTAVATANPEERTRTADMSIPSRRSYLP